MNRRDFFKISSSSIVLSSSTQLFAMPEDNLDQYIKDSLDYKEINIYIRDQISLKHKQCEQFSRSIINKEPLVASVDERVLLQSVSLKLKQTQKLVGYGNFNLLNLDQLFYIARNNSNIGSFTQDELKYIEKIFYTNAADYGFYGKKVTHELSDKITKAQTIKVPYTGHYLYKGEPVDMYQRLKQEVGKSIILTSGVRSVVKQLDLFLYKANKLKGNYSKAAHSLAPPGYSFHGVSDFDVGKVGLGYKNFTSSFAKTQEYAQLQKLGYISIRYPKNNPFGVRFEPWHIKV
ncbi:D-alanyl-D-alanine carboxypeptidase family protein [Sulfurimonas sp. MAG313]|nr:D-alanyl-D-alanine carboxypeptidase family protein [Sulfurimonas sp. MAG313]MDF1880453.1 D-alanyl-D-alanine carboxypeptidase family protein [Sulfurimonas sp. MAG313]